MTVKELNVVVEKQQTQIEELKLVLAKVARHVGISALEAPKPKVAKIPTETVKYDGKEYEFTVAKYIGKDSVPVLCQSIIDEENMAEVERLVLIKSTILREVK